MLSPESLEVGRKQAALDMRDREREFASQESRIVESAVGRGMLHSSITQHQLGEAIRVELEARALHLWGIFDALFDSRELAAEPPPGPDLKSLVATLLDSSSGDLQGHHARAVSLMGTEDPVGSLAQFREEALDKANAAIDRALLLARRPDAKLAGARDDDVLEIKPGLWGVSLNLRALWRRFTRKKA